jgi:dTDP-4-amino-4,6-dideoxygalactose transaminase
MKNPYTIISDFEQAMADYTGAPYAVAVDSCTNAIKLCLLWKRTENNIDEDEEPEIVIPSKTYLSVPMSIIQAGFTPVFDKTKKTNNWKGEYQLWPLWVWDSAKRLTSGMYRPKQYQCLSFHVKKRLNIGKGGMILTDNKDAVEWFKRMRYEGRGEVFYKEDDITMIGFNHYMTPEQAARGLVLLQQLPKNLPDIGEPGDYKDLTEYTVFKDYKTIG